MAEGFEFQPYHVPQQSRRDKLRVLSGQPDNPPGFFPFPPYDPSSDLLTCDPAVKEGGHVTSHHFMGFRNHPFAYLDPDPASVQEISTTNPFLYPPPNLQNMRDFDHSALAAEVVYKPEPLALSLSSQQNHQQTNSLQRYGSGSGVNYGSVNVGSGSSGDVMDSGSRSALGPLGPFTGYASILKGSRFLKPAQQLLEEFCDIGNREIYAARVVMSAGDDSSSLLDQNVESLTGDDDALSAAGDGGESNRKKSRLISMLDEVYKTYKQYCQQMQAVVTSFEYVAGLGNAAPYANLAIKATTLHFKCLKNAITEQIQFRNSDHSTRLGHGGKDGTQMLRNGQGIYSQRSSIHSSEFVEHQPVWRPQRGLPERAVTALRAWLFEHFLHPYPTDSDKLLLAKQTGLSRSQVSNWFINARVRLWKPMVEEIHMLETRQLAQNGSERVDQNANRSSDYDHLPPSNSPASDNPSTSTPRVQDTSSKHTRNGLSEQITIASTQPLNLSYNMPSQIHLGHVGMSNMAGGSSSGVSLTLGLHQNNGVGNLSEPFPINAAQRFGLGLDGNGEGYAMGGFDAQNRHFGRDHHVMGGGQLLHDFVG